MIKGRTISRAKILTDSQQRNVRIRAPYNDVKQSVETWTNESQTEVKHAYQSMSQSR
jgi:hypothetical protein